MNLTELQQEVITITKRPDLAAETLLAVRQATLKLHQKDFFYKDIHEAGLKFDAPAYRQEFFFRIAFPQYRALKYIRKAVVNGNFGAFFTVIQPESVVDQYSVDRYDVCYAAGDSIEIRSSTEFQYALAGMYLHPNTTQSGYASWIALEHPYAIVFSAAELVFKMIGKSEEFAAFKLLRDEE